MMCPTSVIMDPHISIPVFLICWFHGIAGRCTLNHYAVEALFVFTYTYMTAKTFIQEWTPTNLLIPSENQKISSLIQLETGFYIGYLVVDIVRKEREQCLHHAIAITMLQLGALSRYHQFMLIVLFLFSLSNPFLTVSKIVYKLQMWKTSKIAFSCFAFMFIMARCVGVGWLMWVSITSIHMKNQYIHMALNVLALTLYSMQCIWMKRIIRILLR